MIVIDEKEINQVFIDSLFYAGLSPMDSVVVLKIFNKLSKLPFTVVKPREVEEIPELTEWLGGF